MRPQTAMAAVFLLMIGTSAFLIRSKNYAPASKDSAVSVTAFGAPAVTATVASTESLDDKAAAAAHGPTPPVITRPPSAAPAASIALAEDGFVDRLTNGAAKGKADESALGSAFGDVAGGGGSGAGAAPAPTTAAIANAAAPAGAPAQQSPAPAYATKRAGAGSGGEDPFSLGAAAFRARNFAEASRQFNLAAQGGNPNASLWAAESTREGQGCAVALGRFDQLAQQSAGSWVGNEASLRAARCEIAMDRLDAARSRLDRLAQVGSHQAAAQSALAELNQIAARKAGGGSTTTGAAAAAAPRRAAAPAKAPSPAPMRAPEAQEQKKLDLSY